jgi:hypothetical protein
MRVSRVAIDAVLLWTLAGIVWAGDPQTGPRKTQQELMAERGFVRSRGSWRTVQEIELIERAEKRTIGQKEWNGRLERLRKGLDQPTTGQTAAEEIREIADPLAVPALAAALAQEPIFAARNLYVEALSRIRSAEAQMVLAVVAVDHADEETRIAAAERLVAGGPLPLLPSIAAGLRDADNARVNRAAEAIGRLVQTAREQDASISAAGPSPGQPPFWLLGGLIEALETEHMVTEGDGTPEGSTTATFTPSSGGLSMGGGAKRVRRRFRNDAVLETLVALTNVNFDWNVAAWKAWLATRQNPVDYDPRRG